MSEEKARYRVPRTGPVDELPLNRQTRRWEMGAPIESLQEALETAKAEALRLLVPIYITTHPSSREDTCTVSRTIGADQIYLVVEAVLPVGMEDQADAVRQVRVRPFCDVCATGGVPGVDVGPGSTGAEG